MKTVIIFAITLLMSFNILAQQPKNEIIKAKKIAFITNKLDLTPTEAQQFWPIYNAYEKDIKQLKNQLKQIRQKTRKGSVSDTQAQQLLKTLIDIETQMHTKKIALFSDLKQVISAEKMLRLLAAENAFKIKLMETLKNRRQQLLERRENKR